MILILAVLSLSTRTRGFASSLALTFSCWALSIMSMSTSLVSQPNRIEPVVFSVFEMVPLNVLVLKGLVLVSVSGTPVVASYSVLVPADHCTPRSKRSLLVTS